MVAAAAIIGGSSVLSAGAGLLGSGQAASGAKNAANVSKEQYLQTRSDLSPFTQAGAQVLPSLNALAMSGPTGGGPDYVSQAAQNLPMQMTQAQLEQTPGYQFDMSQGLKATQSAAAARGLGVSGASLKGAATFATGLANKTYLDQFNVAQQRFGDYLNLNTGQQGQLTNQFARLQGTATLGANAAAQTGTTGATLAGQQGNYLNQAGLASAAGTGGVGSAVAGGINNYLGYQAFQNALKPTTGGYPGGTVPGVNVDR